MTQNQFLAMLKRMEPTKRSRYKKRIDKVFRQANRVTGMTQNEKKLFDRILRADPTMRVKFKRLLATCFRKAEGKKPHRYSRPALRLIQGGLS